MQSFYPGLYDRFGNEMAIQTPQGTLKFSRHRRITSSTRTTGGNTERISIERGYKGYIGDSGCSCGDHSRGALNGYCCADCARRSQTGLAGVAFTPPSKSTVAIEAAINTAASVNPITEAISQIGTTIFNFLKGVSHVPVAYTPQQFQSLAATDPKTAQDILNQIYPGITAQLKGQGITLPSGQESTFVADAILGQPLPTTSAGFNINWTVPAIAGALLLLLSWRK